MIFIHSKSFSVKKKSTIRSSSLTDLSTLYFEKSLTPTYLNTFSSIKKFPEHFLLSYVKITYAASAIISSVRDFFINVSPPKRFYTAAVAIAVLGHKALIPTPYGWNSSAIPKTHRLMLYFAIV